MDEQPALHAVAATAAMAVTVAVIATTGHIRPHHTLRRGAVVAGRAVLQGRVGREQVRQ